MWLSDLVFDQQSGDCLHFFCGWNLEWVLIQNQLSVQPKAIDNVGTRQPEEEENANRRRPQYHKNFKASQMAKN